MNIDHFFTIGTRHFKSAIPCEDYATSTLSKGSAFGILSDGCSGAMARNDLASRAWSMAAERVFLNNDNIHYLMEKGGFHQLLIDSFEGHIFTNTIKDELASLVCFYADQEELNLWIMGDGGFVVKHLSGEYTLYEIKWQKNTPFYPIYSTDPLLLKNFKSDISDKPVCLIKTRFEIVNSKSIVKNFERFLYDFDQFEKGFNLSFSRIKDGIESFSIVSDGLWTFKENEMKMVHNILSNLADEKDFLKSKFIKEQEKWSFDMLNLLPKDDFAIVSLIW